MLILLIRALDQAFKGEKTTITIAAGPENGREYAALKAALAHKPDHATIKLEACYLTDLKKGKV